VAKVLHDFENHRLRLAPQRRSNWPTWPPTATHLNQHSPLRRVARFRTCHSME
jgi:hypothetical protein